MKTANEKEIDLMEELTLAGIINEVNDGTIDYGTAQSYVLKNDEYNEAFIFATACEIAAEKDKEIEMLKNKIRIIEDAFSSFNETISEVKESNTDLMESFAGMTKPNLDLLNIR
jgi:transcription antitermination factor NusG